MTENRPFQLNIPPLFEVVEDSVKASLPRSFFNPTHVLLRRRDSDQHDLEHIAPSDEHPIHHHRYIYWTSRRHRKTHPHPRNKTYNRVIGTEVTWFQKLLRMREIQYWNISWWIAVWFTIGSLVWCANGFIVFLPFIYPTLISADAVRDAGGWTAWVGATIFFFASWPPIWEAWNKSDSVNLNKEIHETSCSPGEISTIQVGNGPLKSTGRTEKPDDPHSSGSSNESGVDLQKEKDLTHFTTHKKWIWFSTDSRYWHDIGFLGAFVQAWAATIFWISGFTVLPSIIESLSVGAQDGVFWTPQVVGGSGFIISGFFGILEAQPRWYVPAFNSIPWVLSLFNFIGGIGFTLSGIFGYGQNVHWLAYQSSLATFWGSWAFLIASVMQWWETVNYN